MVEIPTIVNLIVSFALAMITGVIDSVANVIEITTMEEPSAKEALKTITLQRLAQGFLEIIIVDLIATIALAMITHVIISVANVIEIATRTMEIIVAFVIVEIMDVITNVVSVSTITMEILLAAILAIAVITCVITSATNVITITTMEILLTATLAIAVIALVITSVTSVVTITTMLLIMIAIPAVVPIPHVQISA